MKDKATIELVELLRKAQSDKDMLDLLKGLLTIGELKEIAKRVQIVRMLKSGVPQREIAAKLNVGIATVTRGSREIKQGRFSQI
jgi:TrpR family trp operon transcriptional repressor